MRALRVLFWSERLFTFAECATKNSPGFIYKNSHFALNRKPIFTENSSHFAPRLGRIVWNGFAPDIYLLISHFAHGRKDIFPIRIRISKGDSQYFTANSFSDWNTTNREAGDLLFFVYQKSALSQHIFK